MNEYHAPTTYRKFDESSNGFAKRFIKQSLLSKRYGVSKSTLTHRITKLELKTIKRGRECYLTPQQLEVLDELDGFLHDNPGGRIDDFISPHQSYRTLNEPCEAFQELSNNTVEHSIGIEPDTLKTQLDEALLRINHLEYEKGLWITHAQNAAYEIEALKKQATDLRLVNSSLSTYATNQHIEKQKIEFERDQFKANILMWHQYAEGMKRELINIAARERSKNQSDNIVQFSNRQHQNIVAPYSHSLKLIDDAQ